jgi:hypothetical protein
VKDLRLSVRTRLTAWYGGLFALAGTALLVTNYLLVAAALPDPDMFIAVRATEALPGYTDIVPARTTSGRPRPWHSPRSRTTARRR